MSESADRDAPIFVAGHRGMVGAAIRRTLERQGYSNLLLRSRQELDLTDARSVQAFFATHRPHWVFLAAAKVGGIQANNTYRADFIHENLAIQSNVIRAAHEHGTARLLFLGSSCIYPKFAPQPIPESALLTGPLEPTNQPYALAKIAGIEMCDAYNRQYDRDFRAAMPTNLYGPGDNFSLENSHVIPALMRKFHEARQADLSSVSIWGTGTPRREFLHVDDMAAACLALIRLDRQAWRQLGSPHVNVGYGEDISIADLARMVARTVGFEGTLDFDASKPDGAPRKLMDSRLLRSLGWRPQIELEQGLRDTYAWFRQQHRLRIA